MLIDKNTVSAENQINKSSKVFYLGNLGARTRILIVGNSITRHGPKAGIGWDGDWGMAASCPEKDYVHRLFNMLTEDGQDVFMRISQCTDLETKFREETYLLNHKEDRDFNADIMIFRLGENVSQENAPYFENTIKQFIDFVCPNGKVVFTTCFWESPIVDNAIINIAKERGEPWIDCCFSKDEKNMALGQFEHYGVSIHPGDTGMEQIAKSIFNVLKA